ncbi:MAG TPA: glycosyltransferase family 39 protein [Coleofasciculaceae cyanobacterium]
MERETVTAKRDRHPADRRLTWVLALLIGVGIVLRFSHLDAKVYWGDEVFTSFRIAGYTLEEVTTDLLDQRPRTVAELQSTYQEPNEARSLVDTVRSLAQDDPQHPPLYYLLDRGWEQLLGSSLAMRRGWAAICSLLLIPAAAGLAVELFRSRLAGWLAGAIVSLSPFHLLYAQEVREYGLWAGMIALAGWMLARALQRGSVLTWSAWAVSLTLMLYTHLFSVIVAAGYVGAASYYLWRSPAPAAPGDQSLNPAPGTDPKHWFCFLVSTGLAGVAFLPWIIATLQNLGTISRTNGFTAQAIALPTLLHNWWLNLARPFADWEPTGQVLANPIAANGAIGLIALLLAASLWDLARHRSLLARSLLWGLMGSQAITLVLLDLSQGGFRSAIVRYLVPCYLGLQLAVVGYLVRLHHQARSQNSPSQARTAWGLGLALLIAAGSSCVVIAPATTWWSKQGSYAIGELAATIQPFDAPWIVAHDAFPRMFSLSYQLNSRTIMQFIREDDPFNVPPSRDFLLFRGSAKVRDRLRAENWRVDRRYQTSTIYPYLPPLDRQAQLWLDAAHQDQLIP